MKKIFNYVLAISAIVIGMAFGSCNEEEFPSPSHPDGDVVPVILTYIIHSGFISGYQNRYGDNLKPPTNVYHRMTA